MRESKTGSRLKFLLNTFLLSLPLLGAGLADWFSANALVNLAGGDWSLEINPFMRPLLFLCPALVLFFKMIFPFVVGFFLTLYLQRTGKTKAAFISAFGIACVWIGFAAGFQVGQLHVIDTLVHLGIGVGG